MLLEFTDEGVHYDDTTYVATPLIVALLCENRETAELLLGAGANCNASVYIDCRRCATDLCSVDRLLDVFLEYEEIVQRVFDLGEHGELEDKLKEWKLVRDQSNSCSESTNSSMSAREDFQDNFVNAFCEGKFSRDKTISRSGSMCSSMSIREDFQDTFVNAFSEGNWQKVRRLHELHLDLDVNHADDNGWCAIHYASQRTDDALEFLLEHGASPNITSRNHNTALCIASQGGYVVNLRLLLRFGADPEYRGPDGWTPLLASINWRQISSLESLLDWGADINATIDNGRGAMHIAMEVRDKIMISTLLERGLDYLRPDNFGTTPLHLACRQGDAYLVGQLMRSMVSPNESVNANSLVYGTPLYTAAFSGSTSMIGLLVSHGAEIDLFGSGLGSALMVACAEGHTAAVATLLSN
ncbi:MAG: hypothetical protein LQ343_007867 [Gyalolechia ehrenbergii]|nr:MAG: hypothetical protein LQ343_007867 [Gyalolechia ehrenbergii]